MSLAKLINRPCVITRRQDSDTDDDYGNEIPDEDLVDTVCELQQRRRDEPDDQGETSDTTWALFLLPDTLIGTADTITVDDVEYELIGAPWEARNPRTQVVTHLEATVRRTAGAPDDDQVGS